MELVLHELRCTESAFRPMSVCAPPAGLMADGPTPEFAKVCITTDADDGVDGPCSGSLSGHAEMASWAQDVSVPGSSIIGVLNCRELWRELSTVGARTYPEVVVCSASGIVHRTASSGW